MTTIYSTRKNIASVNAQALKIATEFPNLSIEEIRAQLPTLVGFGTEDDYTSHDAAVEAWHKAHPTDPAIIAANNAAFMVQVDDSADYSDAQD